jgi:hypothetical protein
MKKILLLTLPIIAFSANSDLNNNLDKYHTLVSKWVMDKSDVVDRYLASKDDNKNLSNTKVSVAYEIGSTSKGKFSNNYDFSLSLNLPRFKDKVNLTLEKVNTYKSLINSKESFLSKSDSQTNSDDNYNLGISFSQWSGKKYATHLSGGVRFNSKFLLEPYVGVVSSYNIKSTKKTEINIKNTLRYYLAGEIKDNISSQLLYNYGSDVLLGWLGNFEYTSKSSKQTLTSEFILQKEYSSYNFYRLGFVANAKLTHFKNPKKNDFYIYFKYHNKYQNKDWMFYEITPSVELRKENKYHTTVGLKLKVGATFGGIRDLFKK